MEIVLFCRTEYVSWKAFDKWGRQKALLQPLNEHLNVPSTTSKTQKTWIDQADNIEIDKEQLLVEANVDTWRKNQLVQEYKQVWADITKQRTDY